MPAIAPSYLLAKFICFNVDGSPRFEAVGNCGDLEAALAVAKEKGLVHYMIQQSLPLVCYLPKPAIDLRDLNGHIDNAT